MRNFSDIKIDKASFGIDPTPKGAKRYLRGTIADMLNTFDRSVNRWSLTRMETLTLSGIIGRTRSDQNLLGSNLQLRLKLGSRLIDLLHTMETEMPNRRFYLVTLLSDRWLSFDRYAHIWLGGMKDAMRQVLRLGNFTGWFGLIELQTLDESVQALGRILLPHGHFIGWSDDPDFDPNRAAARMAGSKRLESRTSAATADVRADPLTSVCNIAAYLMKAPASAKYRVPSLRSHSGFALADCALPPVSAVRQMEILSHVTFDELMLGGGDGGYIRSELVRLIHETPPKNSEIDTGRAARFWTRCRKRTRRGAYEPVHVDRTKAQLMPHPPISLACAGVPSSYWVVQWLTASGRFTDDQISAQIERILTEALSSDETAILSSNAKALGARQAAAKNNRSPRDS